ncbi:hypothetical protein ALC57_16245 [Trachymyrmex cornetzi]|uniref:Uncharacterized protein n=1 Tax=Trachymyrmex cornetzi TaxID=471704 RepID=A0A195DFN0_9HYME|nr:hypothetical protein ALC57_16245 [Trachymyrmex cornetzi]
MFTSHRHAIKIYVYLNANTNVNQEAIKLLISRSNFLRVATRRRRDAMPPIGAIRDLPSTDQESHSSPLKRLTGFVIGKSRVFLQSRSMPHRGKEAKERKGGRERENGREFCQRMDANVYSAGMPGLALPARHFVHLLRCISRGAILGFDGRSVQQTVTAAVAATSTAVCGLQLQCALLAAVVDRSLVSRFP